MTEKYKNNPTFPTYTFDNKLDIKIGLVGNFLLPRLLAEVELIYIFQSCWELILDETELDLIIIDPDIIGYFGDWQDVSIPESKARSDLKKLTKTAHKKNIPLILWHTGDYIGFNLLQNNLDEFDLIFVSDKRILESNKKQKNKKLFHLPPAAATSIFNPFIRNEKSLINDQTAISGFLHISNNKEGLGKIKELGLPCVFYDQEVDTAKRIFDRVKKTISNSSYIDGTNFAKRLNLLSTSQYHMDFNNDPVNFEWRKVETSACYIPQVNVDDSQDNNDQSNSIEDAIFEITRMKNDQIYARRNAHKMWREAFDGNTIRDRLNSILRKLNISSNLNEELLVTVITPTCREDNIKTAIENFKRQNYKNKEMFLALHRLDDKIFEETRKKYPWCNVIQIPDNETVGGIMNICANLAKGDFIFKMDDDDYYGEPYLSDLVLYQKATNCDLLGKRAALYRFDDNKDEVYELKNGDPVMTYETLDHGKNWIAGNTISIKKELILENPFPHNGYSNNDSIFLMNLGNNVKKVIADSFNMVIERRIDTKSHTWRASKQQIVGAKNIDNTKYFEDFIV